MRRKILLRSHGRSKEPLRYAWQARDRLCLHCRHSCEWLLRRLGVRRVILAGTTTPNCIRTTCYDALSLDYDVTVLRDCTSSVTEEIQQANLRDMQNIGAAVMDSTELF